MTRYKVYLGADKFVPLCFVTERARCCQRLAVRLHLLRWDNIPLRQCTFSLRRNSRHESDVALNGGFNDVSSHSEVLAYTTKSKAGDVERGAQLRSIRFAFASNKLPHLSNCVVFIRGLFNRSMTRYIYCIKDSANLSMYFVEVDKEM